MPSRSESFFINLFRSATLRGAIERAARREREQLFEDCASVPVNVFQLAKRRGMQIDEDLSGVSCEEGLLIPFKGGYRVRLRKTATESRKRFSLAHEMGHTFFYKDDGNGPRHKVSVLSAAERAAEERICNLFAAALLMPWPQLREEFLELPSGNPGQMLTRLDSVSKRFRVSVPALLQRLRSLDVAAPPYMLLCLAAKPNPATGADFALRVEFCVSLGSWRSSHIWQHRSAHGLGLNSAMSLFDHWDRARQSTTLKGHFALDAQQGLTTAADTPNEMRETVHLSRVALGKWKNEVVEVVSASRLYAWTTDQDQKAYVLSVLSPVGSTQVLDAASGNMAAS
jgi:hypothetical protein